jgi:hypothetical protein
MVSERINASLKENRLGHWLQTLAHYDAEHEYDRP